MKNRAIFYVILTGLMLFVLTSPSYSSENGRPFITSYFPDETSGDYQTWAATQDERGVLYFGNGIGVLEYDGSNWRLIEIEKKNMIRSMDIDKDGRIYIGSIAEFGYLTPDSLGQLYYKSLNSEIPEGDQILERVWTTHATNEGIFFQARRRIFRFKPRGSEWDVDVWRPKGQFGFTFYLDNKLYVQQIGVGLMQMVHDELQLLPDGEQFKDDRLQVMLPYSEK